MSGLIPCKFFARDTCRYGDNCRFYHQRGAQNPSQNFGGAGFYGNNPIAAPTFNPKVQAQMLNLANKTNDTVTQIEDIVKKDMHEWEYSKIWPFSAYGPVSTKASLPGFEDLSADELRYQTIQNNGNPPQDLPQRLQMVKNLRQNFLQANNPHNRLILERILQGESPQQQTLSSPSAGTWNNSSSLTPTLFSMLNQNNTSSTTFQNFSNATNPQGSSANNFSFAVNPQPTSLGLTNPIGGGDTMDSMELTGFQQQQQVNQAQAQSSQLTGFSFNQTLNQVQLQQKPLSFSFDNNQNQSIGTNISTPFSMGHPDSTSAPMFSAPQNQTTFNVPINQTVQQPLSAAQVNQKFVYSDETDLSSEEKAAFASAAFDFNNIPSKPPPKSYCF